MTAPTKTPTLNTAHQATYDALFRHPVAHNLAWRDVRSLLQSVGTVTDQANGHWKVARNGHTLSLHASADKQIGEAAQVMDIRRFLEASELAEAPAAVGDLVVVIDHHEARVFHADGGGAAAEHIRPYDPHGYGRHLRHIDQGGDGQRSAERPTFYAEIAATLKGTRHIVFFGNGTGESSAMGQLMSRLRSGHPDIAARVIASEAVDEGHMTDAQLVAKARGLLAAPRPHAHG